MGEKRTDGLPIDPVDEHKGDGEETVKPKDSGTFMVSLLSSKHFKRSSHHRVDLPPISPPHEGVIAIEWASYVAVSDMFIPVVLYNID